MRYLPVLCFVLLSGCVTNPICRQYTWGEICTAPSNYVIKTCTPEPGKWDNGTIRPRYADVDGCTFKYFNKAKGKSKHSILVKNTCAGAMAITHELGHADGVKNPTKEGYDW